MDTPESQPSAPPLGSRVELFTPSRVNVYVGFVLGALFVVGGLGAAVAGLRQIPDIVDQAAPPKTKEDAIGRLVSGSLIGGLFVFFGVAGVFVSRSLVGTGIELCENGFRWWPPNPAAAVVLWRDVASIEERFVRDEVPVRLGGPLLSRTFREFVLIARDGSRLFTFNRENIEGVGRLGKRLRTVAEQHAIPWVVFGQPN